MARIELHSLWHNAFPDKARPALFASHAYNEDGFLPLANPKDFTVEIQPLNSQQLYAVSSNNQLAMKQAQDEFLELERQINIIRNPDPTNLPAIKNPQALPDHREFDERKEALLYNYKYDPKKYPDHKKNSDVTEQEKRDSRFDQDPFTQGGFVPNERQFRGARTKAKDLRNLDGWVAVEQNGRRLIPRMFHEQSKDQREPVTRSKTASLMNGRGRTGTEDLEDISVRGTPTPLHRMIRSTRFNGAKIPVTRDASEDPSYPPSRASTPKRKRGDTPLPSIETGSPLKKMKVSSAEAEPPRRKRHNQYTKAKEQREKDEAEVGTKLQTKEAKQVTHTYSSGGLVDDEPIDSRHGSPALHQPGRRRRHAQVTNAKEKAELTEAIEPLRPVEATAKPGEHQPFQNYGNAIPAIKVTSDFNKTETGVDRVKASETRSKVIKFSHTPPPLPAGGAPLIPHAQETISRIKLNARSPIWLKMTAEEKLHHKWDSESLIAAIKDDYTWLPEPTDAEKRAERDRLLVQKNPHRSFSIKNKWRFWKAEGLDKRPRKNKATSNLDGTTTGDETMSTPGPMSEHDMEVEMDHERPSRGFTVSPARITEAVAKPTYLEYGLEHEQIGASGINDAAQRTGGMRY